MRVYYDFEFVEDGSTIAPLSVGLVRQDGRRLYAVVQDDSAVNRAANDEWLRENVVPQLPVRLVDREDQAFGYRWHHLWDGMHPDFEHVHRLGRVKRLVREFLSDTPDPQLWGYYPAYDHVALSQLWGRMVDLPDPRLMATFDVRQEAVRTGADLSEMPHPAYSEHNALQDAIWTMHAHEYLIERERAHHDSSAMAAPFIWPTR